MRWLRGLLRPTVSGLPHTFWWLWAGTLVNRAGTFVLPFLARRDVRRLGVTGLPILRVRFADRPSP